MQIACLFFFCVTEQSGRFGTQECFVSPYEFLICQFVASCFHKHRSVEVKVSLYTPRMRRFSGDGEVKIKVKLVLEQATKVQMGSRCIALFFL